MRISKVIKPLRFLIVLCVLNAVLCFLIEPANGASDTMWSEYYQEEEIDTIFVGSSVSSATFDPKVFNEILGVKSFNMGTPSQAISQSVDALEVAFSEHDIQTVVLGVGFFGLQEEPIDEAEMTFEMALAREKGGLEGIVESINYLTSSEVIGTEKSINYFFPWSYNNVTITWKAVSENVSAKVNPIDEAFDVSSNERKSWRLEKGYRPYTGYVEEDTIWSQNSYYYYSDKLEPKMVAEFEKLMGLCKANGADLIVINTPHPVYDVVSCFEYYGEMEEQVEQLCENYGVDYYNFSLVKPEVFENVTEYFYNFEHLNYQGAQIFSKAFCDFMVKREKGENMDTCFYSVEEYYDIHMDVLEEWKMIYEPK